MEHQRRDSMIVGMPGRRDRFAQAAHSPVRGCAWPGLTGRSHLPARRGMKTVQREHASKIRATPEVNEAICLDR